MPKIKFEKGGLIDERFLEKMEDSGYGDLTHFYGTDKSEKKIIDKLKKILEKKW